MLYPVNHYFPLSPTPSPWQDLLLVVAPLKMHIFLSSKISVCYYFLKICLFHHILFHTSNCRYKERGDKRHNLLICICSRSQQKVSRLVFATWAFLMSGWIPGQDLRILCQSLWEGQEFEATVNLAVINRKWIRVISFEM